jgi:hypothetical protein
MKLDVFFWALIAFSQYAVWYGHRSHVVKSNLFTLPPSFERNDRKLGPK